MRRLLFGLALLVSMDVIAYQAYADDPKIHTGKSGASAVKFLPFTLVELQISDTSDKDGLLWEIEPVRAKDEPADSNRDISWASGQEDKKARFVAPPGSYLATVTIVSTREGGGFRVRKVKYEFEILPPKGWSPVPPVNPDDEDGKKPPTFAAKVKAALKIDPDAALAPKLAEVYDEGVKLSATAATWGDLFNGMGAKATAVGVATKMQVTQTVIAARLKEVIPSKEASILVPDEAGRKKAAAVFAEASAALK